MMFDAVFYLNVPVGVCDGSVIVSHFYHGK